MRYDNLSYWQSIHRQYPGQLRAVGRSRFSEAFNELKYKSEAGTLLSIFSDMQPKFDGQKAVSILDIGAGTGYWTGLVSEWFIQKESTVEVCALDVSPDALQAIKARYPHTQVVQQDLKTIDTNLLSNTFDLVTSFYCLHHLVRIDEFLNGLRFAGRSVNKDGFLILMDPILTQPFSLFDTFDFASYKGNGVPRHLYLLDDVLLKEGLKRQLIRPAVSFLLNGSIEGRSWLGFVVCQTIWKQLRRIYRSERLTRQIAGMLTRLDSALKHKNFAFSSSICIYQKTE